jgi:hypothetical protein
MKGILPWSYSSLTAFETCPRRFKLTRLDKTVTEPPSSAMMHGNEVHKALELGLNGTKGLPEKYIQWAPLVGRIRAEPGRRLVEFKFALTQAFRPTEFFAPDAWVRGVIDAGVVGTDSAVLLDWKTGKPKDDHDQLKLFAGVAFGTYTYVTTVKTGYVWLSSRTITTHKFSRDDVPAIWQEFAPRVQRLVRAAEKGDFPPKPSGLCRAWCPVPKNLCEFSGKQ